MNDAEQCKMNASQTLVFVKNYEDQIFQCTYNVPNCKDHTNFQGNMKMFDLNILGISECRWVDTGRKYLSNDNIHVIFFLAEIRNTKQAIGSKEDVKKPYIELSLEKLEPLIKDVNIHNVAKNHGYWKIMFCALCTAFSLKE